MASGFEVPENLDPPTQERMDKAGWYHFITEEVDEYPTKNSGESIDGLKCELQVLEGTPRFNGISTEIGKRMQALLFHPNGGEYDEKSRLMQYRFAVACGLIDDAAVRAARAKGETPEINVNWQDAKARQFVGRVYIDKGGFAKLTEDIYPIGHAKANRCPVDKAMVDLAKQQTAPTASTPSGLR